MAKTTKLGFKSIAKVLTGISTPLFGVSWNPPKDKRAIVQGLLAFLEDRRALYQPYHMEYGPWVNQSIIEIRKELTETLKKCPDDSDMTDSFRAMRATCRKYLDATDPNIKRIQHSYRSEATFAAALGELRGVFGLHLARLCVAYGVDVEKELASIFPVADDARKKR